MLDKIRARLRSKTYWAAIVMAVLSIVEANAQVLTSHVPAEHRAWILMAWPLVMLTLREVTTGALADK